MELKWSGGLGTGDPCDMEWEVPTSIILSTAEMAGMQARWSGTEGPVGSGRRKRKEGGGACNVVVLARREGGREVRRPQRREGTWRTERPTKIIVTLPGRRRISSMQAPLCQTWFITTFDRQAATDDTHTQTHIKQRHACTPAPSDQTSLPFPLPFQLTGPAGTPHSSTLCCYCCFDESSRIPPDCWPARASVRRGIMPQTPLRLPGDPPAN